MSNLDQRWIQAPFPFFVADIQGNAASFKRGEIKQLCGTLAVEAFKAGGVAVNGPQGVEDINATAELGTPAVEDVVESVRNALIQIRSEGDPGKFTNAGRPRVKYVEELCTGIDPEFIDAATVSDIWDEMMG